MNSAANNAFNHTLRKILMVQAGLVAVVAIILTAIKGHEYFLATLYGGAVIIVSTIFFGWRLRIATQTADNQPALNPVELIKGIVLRFVMVVCLLALGLGWFNLPPAGILSGFIVAQLAFWFSRSSYGVTRR